MPSVYPAKMKRSDIIRLLLDHAITRPDFAHIVKVWNIENRAGNRITAEVILDSEYYEFSFNPTNGFWSLGTEINRYQRHGFVDPSKYAVKDVDEDEVTH